MTLRQLRFVFLLFALFFLGIDCKPTLDEEKRNLCEGEPNLAQCLKEVEEAKASTKDSETQDPEDAEGGDHYEAMIKQEALIKKMVDDNEQNRAYWDEEYKSINKWARYGIH